MHNLVGTTNASAKLSTLLSLFIAEAMQHDSDTLLRFVKRAELTLPLLAALCVVEAAWRSLDWGTRGVPRLLAGKR